LSSRLSASRLPVSSAEAIAPASPGMMARMRASIASRMPSTKLEKRSCRPGASGGGCRLIAPAAKPLAPMR